MWRYSPCTGTKDAGLVTASRVRSSPWQACPLTCTGAFPEWITSAPRRCSWSITRPTDHSLPGIGCALIMTTSSGSIWTRLFSPVAMSESADIGSPWEPVEITHTRPGSSLPSSSISTMTPSSMLSSPSDRASSTLFTMDRPRNATWRPLAVAALAICWTRWMWLAKHATITRRPGRAAKSWRRVSPTADSEGVNPGSSALVESESRRRMPGSSASAPKRARSVRRPSTGSRSSLKSPECRITPWGVWNASAKAWGTEWVTGMNSTSQGPMRRRSPSFTAISSVRSRRPASRIRELASPTVSSEP